MTGKASAAPGGAGKAAGLAALSSVEVVALGFDAAHYRATNPDLSGSDDDLLSHYLLIGWKDGRDPSAVFSTSHYLQSNADVVAVGINPLEHYLRFGKAEGRSPIPARAADEGPDPSPDPMEQDLALAAPEFDAAYYRNAYPDVPGDDAALLLHFMSLGWSEGRDPSADFSVRHYLQTYPDVAASGVNPFLHYLRLGRAEKRNPLPNTLPKQVTAALLDPAVTEQELAAVRDQFDAVFYRASYPDVPGTDEELLVHYMTNGWRERRDPRPDFSTRHYLDTYADIAFGGMNPWLHYISTGRAEGRKPTGTGPLRLGLQAGATAVPAALRSVLARPAPHQRPAPPSEVNPACLDIHWVVPDFSVGGGGHMTIFRMVRQMELLGHRCTIWIEAPSHNRTAAAAHDTIVKHYQCVAARVAILEDGFFAASGDVVIATGWTTAYPVQAATGFAAKYYFVQDHEPEFYATGTEAILARHTYAFDLACICASPWLDSIMSGTYGRWSRPFFLAYDAETYRIPDAGAQAGRVQRPADAPLRIAVYAREHTSRRCVMLALMALELLPADAPPFEVHFFGQDEVRAFRLPYPAWHHGVLAPDELAGLYARCDIGICFSATNYSLVPQEMMACGLPVLELDGDSTRAIFPGGVVTLAGPAPAHIAEVLLAMMNDPAGRASQAQAARHWVEGFTWEAAGARVEAALREYLALALPRRGLRLAAPAVARQGAVAMDVVIPTWNGLSDLRPVIEALRRQTGRDEMRVHCIDSGSTDGTLEWLRAQADVSLTGIAPGTFQHGRTRNEAAALGSAPLIAFLTQDALPATPFWGHDIRQMFAHHPTAAGLFGRHLPYPHHSVFVRDEITTHFQGFLKHPLLLSRDTDPGKWAEGDRGWQQVLHFYSDNNSAMRRDVWREMPYPEIDYGEDQVWARDIIAAGHGKLYAPTAAVYHSHDYGSEDTYDRAVVEGAFFLTHFGYRLGDGSDDQIEKRIKQEQAVVRRLAVQLGATPDATGQRQANVAARHRGWRDGQRLAEVTPSPAEAVAVGPGPQRNRFRQ